MADVFGGVLVAPSAGVEVAGAATTIVEVEIVGASACMSWSARSVVSSVFAEKLGGLEIVEAAIDALRSPVDDGAEDDGAGAPVTSAMMDSRVFSSEETSA